MDPSPCSWVGIAMFLAIQLVPYGRDHTNPLVTEAAAFGPGAGLELARGACFDCHSNETEWPWYTNVAPASWLVQRDVDEGRATLNFSEWDRPQAEVDELFDVIARRRDATGQLHADPSVGPLVRGGAGDPARRDATHGASLASDPG